MYDIKITLDKNGIAPKYKDASKSELCLYSPGFAMVPPEGHSVIDTGVHIDIPDGYIGKIESTDDLLIKNSIICYGTVGPHANTNVKVVVFNHGSKIQFFDTGELLAKLAIYKSGLPANFSIESEQ